MAEMLIELIVMVAPLVLVTVNEPALDMLEPAATVMLTDEVTATLTWARATPAIPPTQHANRIINHRPGRCFTALPPQSVIESLVPADKKSAPPTPFSIRCDAPVFDPAKLLMHAN